MAAVAPAAAPPPPADQAVGLLQKLSLESQRKEDTSETACKPSALSHAHSNGGNAQGLPFHADRSFSPVLPDSVDPNYYMHPSYYFGGYEGSGNEWDARYANQDGSEVPISVYGGDMYHTGYSYTPYPYSSSPSPSAGNDGQLYGTQHYQYATSYCQPPAPTSHAQGQATSTQSEMPASVTSEQPQISGDTVKRTSNGKVSCNTNAINDSSGAKQSQQDASMSSSARSSMYSGYLSASYSDPRYGYGGAHSPLSWSDGPAYSSGNQRACSNSISSFTSGANSLARNYNLRSSSYTMGGQQPASVMGPSTAGYLNRLSPNSRLYNQYGQYGSAPKTSLGYGSSSFYSSRSNGRLSVVDSKYETRARGNALCAGFGNENQDGFSELNRGPRAGSLKNQKPFGSNITIAAKSQALLSIGKQESCVLSYKEHFNREDFPETYSGAKFYVIKSYSEDDVHKSIKYNVWASTPNGNKKLDAGYKEAKEKDGGCPVFLFFSVNTSGQFVGVAEMVSPVDFDKTVEYWQQDKWNGCFSVKWHIVKDVPNSLLKHITLENNDNKPVTNSRDTQEVKLEQGLAMLKIFKDHIDKTSILDDFLFYETRQKLMQEKRAKNQQLALVWDGKSNSFSGERDSDELSRKTKLQVSLGSAPHYTKEAANGGLADRNHPEEMVQHLTASELHVPSGN